jgi:hypothetical protein
VQDAAHDHRADRLIAEAAVALLGLALLAGAALATRGWFERHFLPEFLHPRPGQLRAYLTVRVAVAAAGAGLVLFARPAVGRVAGRQGLGRLALTLAPSLLAFVAAVGCAELVLDSMAWRAREQSPPMYEPRRVRDPALGWRQLAHRTGYGVTGGRQVEYAFDQYGYRVRRQDQPVDLARPTIVVAGESFIQGHGLGFDETMPAQLSAMTGLQTANVAVGGYATDQVYMLLRAELPRFQRPVAVVTIFMPGLFHRNLDTDRPHLVRGLIWTPPKRQPRLAEIFGRLVQYRSDRQIADGVAATQEQLRAMQALARARGADFVILTPQVGPESAEERRIRQRVLDAAGLPYVVAPMPAGWLLPHNRHPNAQGARVMAAAVAAYLQRDHQAHSLARTAAPAAHSQG